MVDKAHRFQGHGSLRFVYTKGQTVRCQGCSLRYVVNRKRNVYRVAVVVSRKVHKSAVVRNRIRRRIYEIVRTSVADSTAYDYVILIYSDQFAVMPIEQLKTAIVDMFDKATAATDEQRAIVVRKEK